jgi:hypothetical protein
MEDTFKFISLLLFLALISAIGGMIYYKNKYDNRDRVVSAKL